MMQKKGKSPLKAHLLKKLAELPKQEVKLGSHKTTRTTTKLLIHPINEIISETQGGTLPKTLRQAMTKY